MFGSSTSSAKEGDAAIEPSTDPKSPTDASNPMAESALDVPGNLLTSRKPTDETGSTDKKRRSSGVAKAKDIFASAKQSFHVHNVVPQSEKDQTPIQRLSKTDPALGVPQGSLNNSAGESVPGPRSTFRVGVTEDKNKKCRRTMEDTHAYLYNFLSTPQASSTGDIATKSVPVADATEQAVAETDNGYFAIFDGHAGTFAADWCGKKLHLILEDTIRKNPSTPIPELLDQTFTLVDQQLEKLPVKNSGCTAVIAVLRWEDRVPNTASATGSTYLNQAAAKASTEGTTENAVVADATAPVQATERLKDASTRQRVLYTANVGDARIVLCRNGRALRLSYDHKGSDEQEGRRVSNAGGLILNNRVNGVLAVTRALGDAYMKDLVTGHPYTTETVIQHETDEFMILACDGVRRTQLLHYNNC
jgi:protein phosphatase PTC1